MKTMQMVRSWKMGAVALLATLLVPAITAKPASARTAVNISVSLGGASHNRGFNDRNGGWGYVSRGRRGTWNNPGHGSWGYGNRGQQSEDPRGAWNNSRNDGRDGSNCSQQSQYRGNDRYSSPGYDSPGYDQSGRYQQSPRGDWNNGTQGGNERPGQHDRRNQQRNDGRS